MPSDAEKVNAIAEAFETLTNVALETRLATFVRLTKRKREIEGDLRAVQDQLSKIEPALIEDMALAGMQNATIDGMCVYQTRSVWPSRREGVETADVIAALTACQAVGILSYNTQSLRSYLRELSDEGREIPPELNRVIESKERVSLGARAV